MYDIEKTWPKWKIVRLIGEGSFGKVFEICRNEFGIEEHSALKVISIPQSDNEVQSLKNDGMTDGDTTEYFKGIVSDFVQEIHLMSQLKGNSNIVAYEDYAVIEKSDSIGFEILIRMELLAGLPKYLRENRFRVIDVIQLCIDICKALEVCRDLNIVHRDIKPDNIFVSATGSYKLGDFGVARTIEKTMAGLSRKGTYSYMAPEIYNGQEYGFEADIYSLGIVLYKLLNNNRDPFLPAYPAPIKYSDKTEAMVKRIQGLPLPKPDNANERLSKIIFKACAHNPAERYQHPKELREDLETIASSYMEIQSEVFSENGNNFYTNNSIFGIANSKVFLNNDQEKSVAKVIVQEIDDENTALMSEQTDDEDGTILMSESTDDEESTKIMTEPSDGQSVIAIPENDSKGEDLNCKAKEQIHTLIGTALPNGFWRCVCGRTNASYVSSCACGINKCDVKLVKEDTKNINSSFPVVKQGNWICSCGRENASYVSSCVCGVNKREYIRIGGQSTTSANKSTLVQTESKQEKTNESPEEAWRRSEAAHRAWLKTIGK